MSLALATVARVDVGFCLAAAALGKTLEFESFSRTIGSLMPAAVRWLRVTGAAFVVIESCVAAYLLIGVSWLPGDLFSLLFLAGLASVSLAALVRKLDVACNCFGASTRRLGRETLPLSVVLLAGQLAFVLRTQLGGFTRPSVTELLAVWAFGLLVLILARWFLIVPTIVASVSQRRHLRGGAS